jgi:quinol monooxygenase YgiN
MAKEKPMRIAHVTFTVDKNDSQRALALLTTQAPTVRALPGCHAFIPFVDPMIEGGIGIVHEWNSAADFSAYLASPSYALFNAELRPLMINPPVGKRFEAEPVREAPAKAA